MDRAIHEFTAVVEHFEPHALRQCPLNLSQPVFGLLYDCAGVRTHQHHGDPADDFALAVLADGTLPNRSPDLHIRNILDTDSDTVFARQEDVANLVHRLYASKSADDVLFCAP